MKNRPLKIFTLISLLASLVSCSNTINAPIEHKDSLYHGKNGVMKLVQISRTQTIKDLAHTYGISAQSIAIANGMQINTVVHSQQLIKIPLSDQNAANDIEQINDEEIDDNTLEEYQPSQEIDEDLAKDIEIAKTPKPTHEKAMKKDHFHSKTPLNSSQFIWPVEGKVLAHYGKSATGFNEGISIAAPLGTIVKAAGDGEVLYVGKEPKVYGNLIILKHKKNYLTAYAHLDKIIVQKGAKISIGQSIGAVGKTGSVSTPQLHFTIRKDKKTINPEGDRPKTTVKE